MKLHSDFSTPIASHRAEKGKNVNSSSLYSRLGARLLLTSFTSAVLAGGAQGQGQSPSQQLPGEIAGEDRTDAVLSLPELRGLSAPEGAELTSFKVGAFFLEGGQAELNARAAAAAPPIGTTISVADLFEYAGFIQSLYFGAGYPLVRVVIPAQDIQPEGSQVRILIVGGYVERIDAAALPPRVSGQVEKLLRPLVGDESISAGELERRILLAGDTAGLRLKTALTPGTEIGATSLIVSGDYRLVEGVVSIDNRVTEDVGREQVTVSVGLNSLLGAGEQVVVTSATALNDPGFGPSALRSYVGVSASVPIGTEGWSVGVQVIQAGNAPAPVAAGVQFDNEFFRTGLSASYALQRARRASAAMSFGFDASYEAQRLRLLGLETSLFADRTRVARAGISGYGLFGEGGQINYDAQISKGIDALGARAASDASALRPLSRDGADANFYKLSAGGSLTQEVLEGLSLQASLRAQSSFNAPLVRSEQASIVSPGLVSGPPSGAVTGDRMIAGRMEAQIRMRVSDAITLHPYMAFAAGESRLEKPTALERAHSGANSFGVGLRSQINVTDRRLLSAQLEWAKVESNDPRLDRDWLGFSVALRF